MIPQYSSQKVERLATLDLDRPSPHKKRTLTSRAMAVFLAANFLVSRGRCKVTAAMIRNVLDEAGDLGEDRGNQWLGDSMGAHGLNLPVEQIKGRKHYVIPGFGISREAIESHYLIPPGWDWSSYDTSDEVTEMDATLADLFDEVRVPEPVSVLAEAVPEPTLAELLDQLRPEPEPVKADEEQEDEDTPSVLFPDTAEDDD